MFRSQEFTSVILKLCNIKSTFFENRPTLLFCAYCDDLKLSGFKCHSMRLVTCVQDWNSLFLTDVVQLCKILISKISSLLRAGKKRKKKTFNTQCQHLKNVHWSLPCHAIWSDFLQHCKNKIFKFEELKKTSLIRTTKYFGGESKQYQTRVVTLRKTWDRFQNRIIQFLIDVAKILLRPKSVISHFVHTTFSSF